jgi:hypothetical protein
MLKGARGTCIERGTAGLQFCWRTAAIAMLGRPITALVAACSKDWVVQPPHIAPTLDVLATPAGTFALALPSNLPCSSSITMLSW